MIKMEESRCGMGGSLDRVYTTSGTTEKPSHPESSGRHNPGGPESLAKEI